MGVNTLGTGAGALLISFFAARLLAHTTDWRVMLHLCGGACLVAFVVCLFAANCRPTCGRRSWPPAGTRR